MADNRRVHTISSARKGARTALRYSAGDAGTYHYCPSCNGNGCRRCSYEGEVLVEREEPTASEMGLLLKHIVKRASSITSGLYSVVEREPIATIRYHHAGHAEEVCHVVLADMWTSIPQEAQEAHQALVACLDDYGFPIDEGLIAVELETKQAAYAAAGGYDR